MSDVYLFVIDTYNTREAGLGEKDKVKIEVYHRTEKQALEKAKKLIKREKYETKFVIAQKEEREGILEQIVNSLDNIAQQIESAKPY